MGKAEASLTYAAWSECECCAQTLNLTNCIIKFKNKFKTLLTPCNGLLLEYTDSNGSLARRKNTLVCNVPRLQQNGDGREPVGCVLGPHILCTEHGFLLPGQEQAPKAGCHRLHTSKVRLRLTPTLKSKFHFLPRLKHFFQDWTMRVMSLQDVAEAWGVGSSFTLDACVLGRYVGVRQEKMHPQRHPPHPLHREKGQGKEVRRLLQASKLKSIQTGGSIGPTPDY